MRRLGFCFPRGSEDGLYGVDESGAEDEGARLLRLRFESPAAADV